MGVASQVATPLPSPLTPVLIGRPLALPSVMVGAVPNTSAPVPVSSVTAAATLALDGVASAVATPVPSPLMPLAIGRPVALVSVAAEGVPRSGVVSVGEVANTAAPLPVSSVSALRKFAEDGVCNQLRTLLPRPLSADELTVSTCPVASIEARVSHWLPS